MVAGPDSIPIRREAKELKRLADALIVSEIEACRDGLLVLPTNGGSARFNRAFADMWGIEDGVAQSGDSDRILSAALARLKAPADLELQVRRFRSDPGTHIQCEVELLDGRVFECHSGSLQGVPGECLGRLWFCRDITEWRRAIVALETSHELLATTERIAHIGGWQHDVVNDVLSWSSETYRIFGCDPSTYTPTVSGFLSAVHAQERDRVRAAISASVTHGLPYDEEFRVVRPDGSVRWVHATAEARVNTEGKVVSMIGTCHDVSDRKQADAARSAAEERLRVANALSSAQLEASPDGILVVGPDRSILSFNGRFVELWSIPAEIVESRRDERAVASVLDKLADPKRFQERLGELYARPEEHDHEEIELKDGRVFERHSSPLVLTKDASPGRIFFFRDITSRKAAESRVVHMADHDALTGLANRRAFVEAVQQQIERTRRGSRGFALLYLDLDHFKDVNDTLGHTAGDQLLEQVAHRLRANIRATDAVARFGGDEFAILQSDIVDSAEVAGLATRLLRVLHEAFVVQGNPIHSGVSIGLTVHERNGAEAEALLSQADLALYRAKGEGRGTYRFFEESMDSEVRARVVLAAELREGIEMGQLFLVYQPQLEVSTGRVLGVEALARWRHPTRGLVSPGVFIPVAEKTGLISQLGKWATREVCRQAKIWLDAGIAPPTVAVNVSPLQFKTPLELEAMIAGALEDFGLPGNRLEVELTEGAVMEAWTSHNDLLVRLRQSGVQVAIDDFGTGFSSLEYLSRFPVDRIKIAQTFVMDLPDGSGSAAIVKATLGLARELGLRVIAEGVETQAQLELLRAWGCREVQGYLLAKPLGVAEVTDLLKKSAANTSAPPQTVRALPAEVRIHESCSPS